MLHPLGVDLDARGLLLRVVEPDVLDRPAVALGARVGDDDAVLGVADLAHPQKPDSYGHCVLAPAGLVAASPKASVLAATVGLVWPAALMSGTPSYAPG